MCQKIFLIAAIFASMAASTAGWKVYVDEMLKEYQENWGTLVNMLQLDPLILGDHHTKKMGINVHLIGGALHGMSNMVLPDGDNFCGELEYPMRVSGMLKFPELFASFEELDILGQRNISVPNVVVKIGATVDPLVEQQIFDVTVNIKHDKPQIISEGATNTVLNKAIDVTEKALDETINEVISEVTASILQKKGNDIDGMMRLLSPIAASELLKQFEASVACDLFNDESGSPCNFYVTKSKTDAKQP